jgi:hypothetical protein
VVSALSAAKSLSCVAPRRGLLRCARFRGLKLRGYLHGVAPRRRGNPAFSRSFPCRTPTFHHSKDSSLPFLIGNQRLTCVSFVLLLSILLFSATLHRSTTPPLQGCHGCHGSARVVSRVGLEKRPVFIDLSRCHGSGPLGPETPNTKHQAPEKFQCPSAKIASIASWRLCVKCGRDGGTSRRVERARFWAGQSLRPAFARRLPPSLGSYGGTSRRARQSGGPAFAGKLRPGKQSVWNGLERSKSNFSICGRIGG